MKMSNESCGRIYLITVVLFLRKIFLAV
jgi:hypothetical protein